jgi:hypothetical protein
MIGAEATRLPTRSSLIGALVVVVVAAIPAAFRLGGLGFYLDDHYFLGLMSTSRGHSVTALFNVLADNDPKAWTRPAMYLLLAALFRLFGTSPLPYHLFVAALVPLCAVLIYLILDRLRAPSFLTLGAPIVFAAAPNYSTDRFWLASYAAPASVALALVSVYAALRACDSQERRLAGWVVVGGAALVLSLLMYEIAVPLLVALVAFLWYRGRLERGSARVAAVSWLLALAAALGFKLIATRTLAAGTSHQFGYPSGFLHHIGYLVSGSVKVNFGTYGVGLPYVVGWIFAHRLTWTAVAASLLVGVLVYAYLARNAQDLELPAARHLERWTARRLLGAGLALFVVGYASFLVTEDIYFTSTGIDNRANIVATVGVAVIAVGLVLWAVGTLSARRQALAFSLAVALLATIGTFITSTLADYWVAASHRQHEVVARLSDALPAKLTNATVVLDGVCPEIGPGIVFAASYDLAGELQARYYDPTIRAPVTTAAVSVEPKGLAISTIIYGTKRPPHFYPYRPRLLIYDWPRRSSVRLTDAATARRYFANTPRPSCPPLRSFTWGIHTSRLVPFA